MLECAFGASHLSHMLGIFKFDPKFAVQTLDPALPNDFKSMCSIPNHEHALQPNI